MKEQDKRVAFSKGTSKESLLSALLLAVFGESCLAQGNACGSRQAVNRKSESANVPLDAQKLQEIKGNFCFFFYLLEFTENEMKLFQDMPATLFFKSYFTGMIKKNCLKNVFFQSDSFRLHRNISSRF